ncbi:MAG: hypothetical protein Q8P95_01880 [bacterium]|nr:hypothetical protein [bacterium]
MGSYFSRDSRSGGGDFDRQMHKTNCAECGDSCEVPFKPNGKKPVYCKKCFERQGGGSTSGSRHREFGGEKRREFGGGGGGSDHQRDFELLNRKLDQILEILEGEE